MQNPALADDPLWFKDAVIYELPVRAYCDSDGDGIGDFRGLTQKLDYLQELGITALWLLPFFPSPQRDDGYDIADYCDVNSIYGSLDDFKTFLEAAHQRGIRVIVELVVNHTSDQHPWFQRARRAPKGSPERDFYVWSDTPDKYQEVRIIFQDFETSNWAWDPVAKAYYWHRFYSHQPDLNYSSLDLQRAVLEVVDFWMAMGVDGMRMDAVPYLFVREGTNCENLPETHAFLKRLRSHLDGKFANRMLLAEANQWPEDAAAYYGEGNECHMNFHFPLMPRLFMSLRMEDNFPIVDILNQTPPIPDNCQWALFLRNHDELTLEMVTDEDRDYMYKVYAQDPQARLNLGIRRRLGPLLGNDRRQIELMNSLLFSLPGTPVLYYGDEIGMGDNIYLGDRNGVRTPMQWSPDRNAGFSRTNPHRLYQPVIVDPEYHYEAVNVEVQSANPNSLLSWMKRLIATRKHYQAFGRGTFELLHSENRKVLSFLRTYDGEHILVVANLSRFVQTVELDLSAFAGMVPVEIFGRTQLPAIGESPYFLSLSPYGFYWFALQADPSMTLQPRPTSELPVFAVAGSWETALTGIEGKAQFEKILLKQLHGCRWFRGKSRIVQSLRITEAVVISAQDPAAAIALLQVEYTEGLPETYVLPLAYGRGEHANAIASETPQAAIAKLTTREDSGILYEAIAEPTFLKLLLDAIAGQRRFWGQAGKLLGTMTQTEQPWADREQSLEPALLKGDDASNTLVSYHPLLGSDATATSRVLLKLFRRVEEGINPELEVGQFLAQKDLEFIRPVVGALEYRRDGAGRSSMVLSSGAGDGAHSTTLGVLQRYIPDTRDAWNYTLDSLRDYLEYVGLKQLELPAVPLPDGSPLALQQQSLPELAALTIGSYLTNVQLLGQRTAELHRVLAAETENPAFTPEPFTLFYQRSIYQYTRNLIGQVFRHLRQQLGTLQPEMRILAQKVLNRQEEILQRLQLVVSPKITALRTRIHGNFSLEEVLYTGKDFVIIDFEGERGRSLNERRIKRSPLRDVAGMLQSFHYATRIALRREVDSGLIAATQIPLMEQWSQFWESWVSAAFLQSYLETAGQERFLPQTHQELQVLLDIYLFEKAVRDLSDRLEDRQDWVDIPLQRLLNL